VWVNGQELVAGGEVTTARSGQVIRAGRAEGS
jgi:hypothetical protein